MDVIKKERRQEDSSSSHTCVTKANSELRAGRVECVGKGLLSEFVEKQVK